MLIHAFLDRRDMISTLAAGMAIKGSLIGKEVVRMDTAKDVYQRMIQSLMSVTFPFIKQKGNIAAPSRKEMYAEMFRRLDEIEKESAKIGPKESSDAHSVEEGAS